MSFLSSSLSAQDLEPRLLSAMPTGGNFAIASYVRSSGNILLDSSLPVEDLNANLDNLILAYASSFKLLNKLSKFDFVTAYSFGDYEGAIASLDSTTNRNGFGDPLLRLSVVLVGVEPHYATDYAQYEPKNFKLGVMFRVRPPLGTYYSNRYLNIGTNRWSFKPGIAGSYRLQKLIIEGHISAWFFTANNDLVGNTVQQEPMLLGQLHINYVFKEGIWLAVSVGKSFFGKTIVNGQEQDNEQNNGRFGVALAYRLSKHSSLKLAFTSGVSTRYGTDFNSFIVAYQFMWFNKSG